MLVAHQGGGNADFSDALTDIIQEYPNVKMELCSSLANSYSIEDLVDLVGEDRLVYGSDLINLDPCYDFGKVAFSPIEDKIKAKIFSESFLDMQKQSQMGVIEVRRNSDGKGGICMSQKLRTGIIGMGYIGESHIEAVRRIG